MCSFQYQTTKIQPILNSLLGSEPEIKVTGDSAETTNIIPGQLSSSLSLPTYQWLLWGWLGLSGSLSQFPGQLSSHPLGWRCYSSSRCLHLLLCPLGAQLRLSSLLWPLGGQLSLPSLLKQSQWVSLDLNPRGMKQRSLLQALRSLSQRSSHCLAQPRLSQRSLSCLLLLSPSQRSAHLCHATSCTLQACHTTHTPARAATPHPRLPGLPCHVLHHLYQPCSK